MDFLGNYRGTVLDNTGTKKNPASKGRCKIWVPSIFPVVIDGVGASDSSYKDKLPWAEPAMPIFGGSSDGQGMCSWPEVGATVWVFFEGGDIKHPVYFATIPGGAAWIAKHNQQYAIHTEKTQLTIDDNTGEVTLIVATGVNIQTPITNIDGELHVTGDIKGDGEVKDHRATMTNDRLIFDNHIHPGVLPGPSSTGPSPTPQS